MTAIATICALTPLAVGVGGVSIISGGLAVVVILFQVNIMRIVMNTVEKLTRMVKRGVVPLGFLTKQPTKGHPSC